MENTEPNEVSPKPVLLLVDDNENNLKVLYQTLGVLGCKMVVAKSGADALLVAERTRPDVILLDILMPGMDGFETCDRLKSDPATADAAIIFLSALSETPDKVRGFETGAVDYISKPFQPAEMLARVRTQLTLRKLQADLKQRNAELAELNEQKNRLLGMAAHDLRNPLGVISGYARLLERGVLGPLNSRQEDVVRVMKDVGARMLTLIDDLLNISQIESGHLRLNLQKVDPKELFTQSVRISGYRAQEKAISMEECVQGPLHAAVEVDPNKIQQVLENLLSNAVKFSPGGTTITASLRSESDRVVFEVADQGPGIPPDELDTLFLPFSQSSVKATAGEKGSGLGLSIAKRIVEGHGGGLRVESRVGEGSTFTVWLPGHD